jgi:putative transposase
MIRQIPQDKVVVSISQFKDITKAYKYELMSTKKQEAEFYRTVNTCKDLYNYFLEARRKAYEEGGWSLTYDDQQADIKILRAKEDELGEKLRNVYEHVEQNVADRVDVAYQHFYRRIKENIDNNVRSDDGEYVKPGHPRFKNRNRYKSFTFPQYGNGCQLISMEERDEQKIVDDMCKRQSIGERNKRKNQKEKKNKNKKNKDNKTNKDVKIVKKQEVKRSKKRGVIRISGIGDVVFIKHREIGEIKNRDGSKIIVPYAIKTVTIKKEIDKWFVVFTIETFVEIDTPTIPKPLDLNRVTGIDLNLMNYAALDGKKIVPKKYLRESEKKLAKEQKRLSRKKRCDVLDKDGNILINKRTGKNITEYSKNGEKQKIKVAKIHRKIANQRENFGREVGLYGVNNYDLLVFEQLGIDDMRQNRQYAKAVSDAGWYQTQMFTKCKAEWAGKIVDFVDPRGTSQNCCYCGSVVKKDIWERAHSCPFCGLIIDRDHNSQIVILKRSKYYIEIFKKSNISMENDVLRRISMCKGIFRDTTTGKPKFMPEQMGSIPEKIKKTIRRRKKK